MTLLGHGHHRVPFEETPESLERHQLIVRCNDLAAEVREKERRIAYLENELRETNRALDHVMDEHAASRRRR